MSLQVGIIGMPNVGKSTLLNALAHTHAESSNYPFCTIEKNVGVAVVDDPRLRRLAEALHPEESIPATVQFVDIAGLVRGASKGEGLGNRFLGHVREADALLHLVRAFEDASTVHVDGSVDPVRDLEIVRTELLLADLETVERQAERVRKQAKGNPRVSEETLARLDHLAACLDQGRPVSLLDPAAAGGAGASGSAPADLVGSGATGGVQAGAGDGARRSADPPPEVALARELCLLTLKPSFVVVNTGEDLPDLPADDPRMARLLAAAGTEVIPLSVRLEEELSRLAPEDRAEMARDLGLAGDALARVVDAARRLLGLVTFYTIANEKLRAWLIPSGTRAPRAAGRIHTDMERGFIRMEVFSVDDLIAHGGRAELHRHGLIRTEGKEYVVRDGDVVQVLFQP